MAIWSSLKLLATRSLIKNGNSWGLKRFMSEDHHRVFPLQPSRFQWQKFKDYTHFYVMVGVIPLALLTAYTNVFIGPATLSEIPEDYVPKHWEYYRHPITRFIARYFAPHPQQEYEKYLHYVFEEGERVKIRILEDEIKTKMSERNDYQAYYYRPVSPKYHKAMKETADEIRERVGID